MRQVGVLNEGRCSSTANGPSKRCKRVFNKECAMPWCHTVVNFEVKMSRFQAVCPDNRPDGGSTSEKQAVFLPR